MEYQFPDTPDEQATDNHDPQTRWPVHHRVVQIVTLTLLALTSAGILVQIALARTIFLTDAMPELDPTATSPSPVMVTGTNGCLYRYTEFAVSTSWVMVVTTAVLLTFLLAVLAGFSSHATSVLDLVVVYFAAALVLVCCLALVVLVPQIAVHGGIHGWLQLCAPY